MENHIQTTTGTIAPMKAKVSPAAKKTLLILNCILILIGNCGGPLIMRLYFVHGGDSVWLSAFLETAGWPFIMVVLIILYFRRRMNGNTTTPAKFVYMRPRLFIAVAVIGIITGFDDYLYAYGVSRLPVSTTSLIVASQLAFTAFFAYVLVRQKFTPYSINAVVLLTAGAGVLAMHTSGDRPAGESQKMYVIGFVMTVAAAAAALYGFMLPLIELMYNKANQEMTYTLVLEVQTVMGLFATIVCTVGMIVSNDFAKFTPYSINAVELLTTGAGVLAMHTCSDRPAGESQKIYVIGFVMTVAAAAALYGFMLPLIELMYNKPNQEMTYTLVLEVQMVMGLFAKMVCTVGMIVNNDFAVIPREATEFDLGKTKYYTILCASALIWQFGFLGAIGVIFCASSLFSGIVITVLVPVTEVLAVIVYKEKFQVEKGVSLVLSLWGFASYFYGEYKLTKKIKSETNYSQQSIETSHSKV